MSGSVSKFIQLIRSSCKERDYYQFIGERVINDYIYIHSDEKNDQFLISKQLKSCYTESLYGNIIISSCFLYLGGYHPINHPILFTLSCGIGLSALCNYQKIKIVDDVLVNYWIEQNTETNKNDSNRIQ